MVICSSGNRSEGILVTPRSDGDFEGKVFVGMGYCDLIEFGKWRPIFVLEGRLKSIIHPIREGDEYDLIIHTSCANRFRDLIGKSFWLSKLGSLVNCRIDSASLHYSAKGYNFFFISKMDNYDFKFRVLGVKSKSPMRIVLRVKVENVVHKENTIEVKDRKQTMKKERKGKRGQKTLLDFFVLFAPIVLLGTSYFVFLVKRKKEE